MTAADFDSAPLRRRTDADRTPVRPVSLARTMHSEWIKLRSLRSTVITMLAAVVLMIFIGLVGAHQAGQSTRVDPISVTLRGYAIAQLAVGVLGVLVVSGEYATGMIRATLTAVPTRTAVLAAKSLVFGAVTLLVMGVTSFVTFFGAMHLLSARHLQTTLAAPGVMRCVVGAALYLTVVGLIGVGLGALLRNTAGGIFAVIALLVLLPQVLPSSWDQTVGKYLPSVAGEQLIKLQPTQGGLSPWAGFAVMSAYAAVALICAGWLLKRRDA